MTYELEDAARTMFDDFIDKLIEFFGLNAELKVHNADI